MNEIKPYSTMCQTLGIINNMTERISLIRTIIENGQGLSEAKEALKKYPWDYTGSCFKLTKAHIEKILNQNLKSELSNQELEDWANFIECREDVDYAQYSKVIEQLANPILHGKFSEELVKSLLENLH